jgi:hypothetical protein
MNAQQEITRLDVEALRNKQSTLRERWLAQRCLQPAEKAQHDAKADEFDLMVDWCVREAERLRREAAQ